MERSSQGNRDKRQIADGREPGLHHVVMILGAPGEGPKARTCAFGGRPYKYLSMEYVFERNQQLGQRLGKEDIDLGRAHKWRWDKKQWLRTGPQFETEAIDLTAPNFDPGHAHSQLRWWEPFRKVRQRLDTGAI